MASLKDPYATLGVSKTATQDEIKKAYRGLAKKHHPDLNPGNKAAEARFKEISLAYELIGTPEARAKFDRGEHEEQIREQQQKAGAGGGPFYYETQGGPDGGRYTYSFGEGMDEELFEQLFGGRARRPRGPRKGEDQLYRMEIDLRDSVLGAEREITLPSGKHLAVKIPAGIAEGSKLRFAGQGGPGIQGGPPGDAYVEIHVREDARFRREGDTLVLELPIGLADAVLGGEVRAPTIEGEVLLRIPPRSNTGTRLKLAGKGAFDLATRKRGDEIVILKVMLPAEIDSELEEAIRAWKQRHPQDARGAA